MERPLRPAQPEPIPPHVPRAERIQYPIPPRLHRIRFISRLMDQCITLPMGRRIGLDPLLGLIPGVGDLIGTTISFYLVYESARLGVPVRVLGRMVANIAMETVAGLIPIAGDVFDAVWQANTRNMRLLEQHYHPSIPQRSAGRVRVAILVVLLALLGLAAGSMVLIWKLLVSLASGILGA